MNKRITIYLHFPCFDGIVSSVLASDFLERTEGCTIEDWLPVTYDVRGSWLSTRLKSPFAVLDFLYHPAAVLWADHHQTTFVSERARKHFVRARANRRLIFDPSATSCSTLLWRTLPHSDAFKRHYEEMVIWADKIDAAKYVNVQEAIHGDKPALQINLSLMLGTHDYCVYIVNEMRKHSLDYVASLPKVRGRYAQAKSRIIAGLERLKPAVKQEDDGLVTFDVSASEDVIISRYAPYYFFPEARYSLGVVRSSTQIKVTAMRNPWRDFESANLGRIFEEYGGGGHQRVASVCLPVSSNQYQETLTLKRIVAALRLAAKNTTVNEGALA